MNYDELIPAAFAGMKADMGDDRVESHPADENIPFGYSVWQVTDGGAVSKSNTGARKPIGIAVHSHAVTGNGYRKYDSVSVMTRGLIWAVADIDRMPQAGTQARADADSGKITNNGVEIKNAVIRDIRTINGEPLALVELHSPKL